MRKNIFEILNNQDINIRDEILKIEQLFWQKRVNYGLYHIANQHFLKWEYRGTDISLDMLIQKLNLPNFKRCLEEKNFLSYYNLTENDMFNYFEVILNMIDFIQKNYIYEIQGNHLTDISNTIVVNIRLILEKYGYRDDYKDNRVIIVEISKEATAVAENYEDIAQDVIEYKRFSLKGNLKRKRELLCNLSNKYEEIRPRLNSNCCVGLTNNIGTILNRLNIRHNNTNEDYVKSLSNHELEEWYDMAYDIVLLALMQNRYFDYAKEIENLKNILKTQKQK